MAFADLFTPVTPTQAAKLLTDQEGGILFIGRDSCPYCQRFVPKLQHVAEQQGWTVHFLHSEDPATFAETQALRQTYQVPTVPGLLVAASDGVRVRCDSSMTEEEILAFVQG